MREMISYRKTLMSDVDHLPEIERCAAAAFLSIPELAWIASDDVMTVEEHAMYLTLGTSWIAQLDSQRVGFVVCEVFDSAFHVWELAVTAWCQRKGIGRGLMETAIAHARATGLREVTLTTFIGVRWNEPFYHSLGFETLPLGTFSNRLETVLAGEGEHGLKREDRCAMRLLL